MMKIAFSEVFQANARGLDVFGRMADGVGHRDLSLIGGDDDFERSFQACDVVFEGIFHQKLDPQSRKVFRLRSSFDSLLQDYFFAIANLHQVHVVVDDLQLPFERVERLYSISKQVGKIEGQLADKLFRLLWLG